MLVRNAECVHSLIRALFNIRKCFHLESRPRRRHASILSRFLITVCRRCRRRHSSDCAKAAIDDDIVAHSLADFFDAEVRKMRKRGIAIRHLVLFLVLHCGWSPVAEGEDGHVYVVWSINIESDQTSKAVWRSFSVLVPN